MRVGLPEEQGGEQGDAGKMEKELHNGLGGFGYVRNMVYWFLHNENILICQFV